MKQFSAIAAAAFLSLAPAAWSEPGPAIEARADGDVLVVRYRLAEPTERAVFQDRGVIRDRWSVVTPGLTLEDGAVTGDVAFDAFELRISPDAAEVDRTYMGLTRVGEGLVVYGPGLRLAGHAAELRLTPADGETTLPLQDAIRGHAYLGPESAVTRADGAVVVVGSTATSALADPMREAFTTARAFYQERLGGELPYEPTLIISVDSPGPTQFRGDVTDTGVISTRFHGDWSAPPPGAGAYLRRFVWHETFHLWNSHGVEVRDGDTAPWLHEGAAEYASLVGLVSEGGLTEAEARAALTRNLNGCRKALGDRDYQAGRLRSGSAVYDCGVVIQWLADLETRRVSDGQRSILDMWSDLLSGARAGDGVYGLTEFRAAPAGDHAVALLTEGAGTERWPSLERRFLDLGVVLEKRPSDDDYQVAALFHLNGENCEAGSNGYYVNEGRIKLDTGQACGVLSGDPEIATVEGRDPVADARAMFEAVQMRCASAQVVRYVTQDGRTLEAVCGAPLATPAAYAITGAPPLALTH